MVIKELEYPEAMILRRGDSGTQVRRIQEWLTLSGISLVCDGEFGPATQSAVNLFRQRKELPADGKVTREVFMLLSLPLQIALGRIYPKPGATLGDVVIEVARQHLSMHPREVGGDNRGPWVRYYNGADGPLQYWCAGFVTKVLQQACEVLKIKMPIPGSVSCDELAAQAKQAGRLHKLGSPKIGKGAIFLIRKSEGDWIHTGFSEAIGSEAMRTIEGNTNDDGSRNGYEVCSRMRSLRNLDFITL